MSVTYFRVPSGQRGLTRQRNYGLTRATGALLAFLDDDTVPEEPYFQIVRECFARHPDAAGVGGYINEVPWRKHPGQEHSKRGVYRAGDWERPEGMRWRMRKALSLAGDLPPGWLPPSGHGRPISYLPPDGSDYKVEFFMGGAATYRRNLFDVHRFSIAFDGYGLYEDMDFCLRAGSEGPLFVCTSARLAHYHEPSSRPNPYRYGSMVVKNGWDVWRLRWPKPSASDRARWWAVTWMLAVGRLVDVCSPRPFHGFLDFAGRFKGAVELAIRRGPAESPPEVGRG